MQGVDRDYKHWKNNDTPGQTCYVTCTCLDFAHLMRREEMRSTMALKLLESCVHNDARLHAFVVMPHHIHFLATPSESQCISQFMRSFKSYSAKSMLPMLNSSELAQLSDQTGLNKRTFWKVSFRGLPVYTDKVFRQKVAYIHQNPVRAEYVTDSSEYHWSSSRIYELGLHDGFRQILLRESIEYYNSLLSGL